METDSEKKTRLDVSEAKEFLQEKITTFRTAFVYILIFVAVLFVFLLLLTTFLGYKFSIL